MLCLTEEKCNFVSGPFVIERVADLPMLPLARFYEHKYINENTRWAFQSIREEKTVKLVCQALLAALVFAFSAKNEWFVGRVFRSYRLPEHSKKAVTKTHWICKPPFQSFNIADRHSEIGAKKTALYNWLSVAFTAEIFSCCATV